MQIRALQYVESNQLYLPKDAVLPPLKLAEIVGQDLAELAGPLATAVLQALVVHSELNLSLKHTSIDCLTQSRIY
jgi:hypothetical protein